MWPENWDLPRLSRLTVQAADEICWSCLKLLDFGVFVKDSDLTFRDSPRM